ncbi:glycosyltransferase family 4 protein [Micromonospora sp. WMMA1923]|uniref:glycosyltransferase family 4 protein n=1 Tax=Micromonospora sp. WMMA1923 TaxID=3404125 RepID=UPI003B953026
MRGTEPDAGRGPVGPRVVYVVLPGDIDDPGTPSGGNHYDRRVLSGLTAAGWTVREHALAGGWPHPDEPARSALDRVLAGLPVGGVVLLDGLVASTVPAVLAAHADRLRLVVLVHMPLHDDAEARALATAAAVVTTSGWTRRELLDRYALPADRVRVARPGVDPAPPATGSDTGSALLCVAALAPHKGQDVLVEALAALDDDGWSCTLVGSLTVDAGFVDRVRALIRAHRLDARIHLVGPRTAGGLAAAYAAADLLVLPSHAETYGMVVTEALARGLPVLASSVGGVPEALGETADGQRPGLLVPAGQPAALAEALRRWLDDDTLRTRLRQAAHRRRDTLTDWSHPSAVIAQVLEEAT